MLETKLKNTYKKLIHYFSIFTIILGTTFGTMNAANAGDVDANTTFSTTTSADYVIITNAGITLTFDSTLVLAGDNGTIIDTVSGNVIITSAGDADPVAANSSQTFTSIDLDVAGGNGDITITDADDRTGTFIVTIDGAGTAANADLITDLGDLVIQSLEDTDDEDMTVNIGGLINVVAGTTVISTAGAGDVTVNAGTNAVAETITFGGGLTLTESSTGNAILNVKGTGAVTGAIVGGTAGQGTIVVSGEGATFATAIGATGIEKVDINNTATFNNAVTATTIEVIDAKVATFKDDIVATSIALDATSNLTIAVHATAANTSITGTIDGIAAGEGIITVNNTAKITTFVSAVGGTRAIEDINVDQDAVFNSTLSTIGGNIATGKSVTVKGDTTIGADELVIVGSLIVGGTGAQTITGVLSGDASAGGVLDITNTGGTVTFATAIGATENDILAEIESNVSTTSIFNGVIDTSLFDIKGHVTITQDDNTGTNITLADGATLVIDDTITNGQKVFLTSTSVVAASIVNTGSIKMPSNLTNGQTIELFEDVTTGAVAILVVEDVNAVLYDTAIRDFTASLITGDDVLITSADRTAAAAGIQLGTTKNVGAALLQATIAASTNATTLDVFTNALNAEGGLSATADTALALQVAPQDDMISGSTFATKAMTGTVQGIISNRMASLRSGDAYYGMGMSAGNMTAKSGFIQAFGSEVEQKNKTVGSGTQYGYESSSAGIALGFDGTTDTGATVGLSFSMSNTDLDGKGTGRAKNDIDSYTASLYWDKTGQNGYVEGSLTYGLNENKTSRLVNTAGLNRTYTGSYDSNQLSLSLGGGAPNAVGASGYVTPFIGFTGTHITTDTYTETSNTSGDNLRLRVAQDDINSLVGKVGVKYHNVTDKGTPMISLSLNNEFGDDTINSTNTYQGGGSSFTTSTDVEPLSATLGLGYSYGSDTASIEFAYEAEANDDKYLGHYGSIKIVGKF